MKNDSIYEKEMGNRRLSKSKLSDSFTIGTTPLTLCDPAQPSWFRYRSVYKMLDTVHLNPTNDPPSILKNFVSSFLKRE